MFLKLDKLTPPLWAPEGHSQTLIGHLFKAKTSVKDEVCEKIKTLDGENLLIKLHLRDPKKWVVLGHGLAGSSESNYILRLTELFNKKNYSVLRFNHRNCGDSLGFADSPYNSGRGEDLFQAIKYIQNKYLETKIVVAGFSLSGNVVLDMLCRFEDQIKVDLAMTINAPIDLKASSLAMTSKKNTLYRAYFVNELLKFNDKMFKLGKFASKKNIKLKPNASLIDYDQAFTAPLSGYTDAWDYYEKCSTFKRLHLIKTETHMLTASDDPFIPVETYLDLKLPSNIELNIQSRGGHMGYLTATNSGITKNRWMDSYVHSVVSKVLG